MNKVEKTSTCWNWKAGKNVNQWGKRYGTFTVENKLELAHRVGYELFKGRIPKGKILCHTCDNEACVNPSHLWIGTYKDNMKDMQEKNRQNYFKGEHVPSAKLSNQDVRDIKEMKLRGTMNKDLAILYGVTRHTIQNILSGRNRREE